MPETQHPRYDVAIIGCGPTGAGLANLLGQAGLSVVVLEREAAIYPLPRAIHFDGEVMRVFHGMGLAAEIEAVTRPGLKGMRFINAAGQTLLMRGGTAAHGPHGCANNHYFHQPELEAVLRQGLARFDKVRVLLRHEVFAIAQDAHGAHLSVEDTASGRLFEIDASYVVGCDGARSLVRRLIGAPMKDLGLVQPWLVFDAILKREVELSDHTLQICDPARPMTYCNVLGRRRRWEIMLLPGEDPFSITRPEHVWPLVKKWITPQDAELERAVVYTFRSVVADGWRKGRLLIAGDSAHQTPPFLGQGMCAGIRDIDNLAWKLVQVLRHGAPDALLDTYEAERSPHVHAFIELAVRLGDIIQTRDPVVAAERDRKFADSPEVFSFPQPNLGPGLLAATPHAGSIFPQPRLADGRALDQALDKDFGLVVKAAVGQVTAGPHERVVTATPGDALDAALDALGVAAALLRPDRYIFGTAQDAAGANVLQRALHTRLATKQGEALAA
jgi:3-(3-hydroxy-phenyl)propionate hydroxylase